MSGVSITSGANPDLSAIVAGGDAFLARVKTFQDAKIAAEAALDNLNLGKNVAAVMAEAQAREAKAQQAIDDAQSEAYKIVAEAKTQAAAILADHHTQAQTVLSSAKAQVDGLDEEVKTARKMLTDWSDQTKAEANSIMGSAVAAKAKADKLHADNHDAANKLAVAQAQAEDALKKVKVLEAALVAKLDAIKAAAS